MRIIGIILVVVGVILFFVRTNQSQLSWNLKSAHSTNIAELKSTAQAIAADIGSGNWHEYVRIWGKITVSEPLVSEIKQESCVYYQMSVRHEYEEIVRSKNQEGNWQEKTNRKFRTVANNKRSTPFEIEDQTGKIEVNPDDAEIDTVKVLDEFIPGETTGGIIKRGNFSLVLNNNINSSRNKTLGYRYRESILPVGREVLVLGEVSDETGILKIGKPLSKQQNFLISLQSYQSLIHNINQNKRNSLYGMIACLIIGICFLIFGFI